MTHGQLPSQNVTCGCHPFRWLQGYHVALKVCRSPQTSRTRPYVSKFWDPWFIPLVFPSNREQLQDNGTYLSIYQSVSKKGHSPMNYLHSTSLSIFVYIYIYIYICLHVACKLIPPHVGLLWRAGGPPPFTVAAGRELHAADLGVAGRLGKVTTFAPRLARGQVRREYQGQAPKHLGSRGLHIYSWGFVLSSFF